MSGQDASVLRDRLIAIVTADRWLVTVLETVRALNLPDWAVGAGAVRNLVWDTLTGRAARTWPGDIDVLYFDPDYREPGRNVTLEERLHTESPHPPWQVRNQARMHLRNGDRPYRDTEDALSFWLETPTCVAVRLENDGRLTVLAPHGLDDLFGLALQPTPRGRERAADYRARLASKPWRAWWPEVRIINV